MHLALIVFSLLAPAPPTDLDRLQGPWVCVAMERNGKAIPPERYAGNRLIMEGERFTFKVGDRLVSQGKRRLDPTTDPAAIDDEHTAGSFAGKSYRGIYKLEGDRFTTCNGGPGQDRPTEFATRPGSGLLLVVYEREKPAP